jgi:hypothetical protein
VFVEVGRATGIGLPAGSDVVWTDGGLLPGVTYNYRIRGAGPRSALAVLFVQASTLPVPRAPSGLSCQATNDRWNSIRLTWSRESLNESGFRIERAPGTDGLGTFVEVGAVWPAVTAFNDTSVRPDTSYTYRIFACNGFGDSAPSTVATVRSGL